MIKLVTDTSSDYLLDDANNKNIALVPMAINIAGKSYLDAYELSHDKFYQLLTTNEEFPKTSQPSPEAFLKIFKEAQEQGDEIICVLISSELSGTCQSAHLAKNMIDYDKIHIIDSLGATFTVKLAVDYAHELIQKGLTATEIVEKVESLKSRATVYAALDTLEYLYKGGRLSRASATIGELANIKPIITITDGKITVPKKCIGKNKAISALVKLLDEVKPDPSFPVYSVYTLGTENAELLESKIQDKDYKNQILSKQQIGATIGTHVGPGAFGFVYIRAE